MKYNISKKLFEAVIGFNDVNLFQLLEEEISYTQYANLTKGTREGYISYNDFFFKCKEWALKQGYIVNSSLYECQVFPLIDGWIGALQICFDVVENDKDFPQSEQQAVFDACMYILENKDKS